MCLIVYVQDRNQENIKYYNCLGGTILGEHLIPFPCWLCPGEYLWDCFSGLYDFTIVQSTSRDMIC